MMRLALWQAAGPSGDPRAAAAEVARAAAAAAAEGADLLVFPEGFLTGYHRPGLAAAELAGVEAALAAAGAAAARERLALVLGTHLAEGGRLRNAAVAFAPSGVELGRYHKRALFGAWEKATFAPGDGGLLVFGCAGLRVGVAICYDVEFPELLRPLARAGADLVVAPTALARPNAAVARRLVPARAMENQIFLGYCNRTGREAGLAFVGLSRICGPRGETLARAGARPALLLADLDAAALAAARAEHAYLADLAALAGRP